jgi:hypothetical protein
VRQGDRKEVKEREGERGEREGERGETDIPSSKSFAAKTPRPCTGDLRISTPSPFVSSAKYFSSSV